MRIVVSSSNLVHFNTLTTLITCINTLESHHRVIPGGKTILFAKLSDLFTIHSLIPDCVALPWRTGGRALCSVFTAWSLARD